MTPCLSPRAVWLPCDGAGVDMRRLCRYTNADSQETMTPMPSVLQGKSTAYSPWPEDEEEPPQQEPGIKLSMIR